MSLPLENTEECFDLYFPKCMAMRIECPNLMVCHNKYAFNTRPTKHGRETLLRIIDDDIRFWKRALTVMVLSIPIIYIILLFLGVRVQ